MIEQIPINEGKLVAFRLSGKLSHADYQTFLPRLSEFINTHGRVSMLLELVDFDGWDLAAAYDDFRFGTEHADAFERIAIVGHGTLQRWMTRMAKPFTSAEIRFFEQDLVGDAWDWLRESDRQDMLDRRAPDTYQQILAAVDFSRHSVRVLRRALDLAKRHGSQINLVHAVESRVQYDDAYDPLMVLAHDMDLDHELVEAAKKRMQSLIAEVDAGDIPNAVLLGSPKSMILSQAEALNADLIVLGTQGHRGLARLLGSTARAVTLSARCDVLTVRIGAED